MAQQPPPTGDGAPVSDPSPNPADSATPTAAAATSTAATSTAATSTAVAPPAATVTGPTAAAAPPGSLDSDWAAQVVGSLDHYIALVRDRTTKPAVVVTRAVVFGLIIAILGVAAIVLLWIAWITGITALVKQVWITYLITGGIFVLVGAFLMAKRRPREIEL